MKVLWHI